MRFVRHTCPTLVVGPSVIERDYYRCKLNERLLNESFAARYRNGGDRVSQGIEVDYSKRVCRKYRKLIPENFNKTIRLRLGALKVHFHVSKKSD